jgi:hypothetical protein
MSTTEMAEPVYTKSKRRPAHEPDGLAARFSGARSALVRSLLAFFLAAAAGFSLAGVENIKNQLTLTLQKQMDGYRWLVLVQGAQIDIDEVGRSLEKFPGLKDASYISPETAFDRLKQDAYLSNSLSGLTAAVLPAAWDVRWSSDFSVDKQDAFVAETRALPGVVDVAMDEKALNTIQLLRQHILGVRVVLAGLVFLLVVIAIVAGLKPLLAGKPIRFNARHFLVETGIVTAGWAAGIALLWVLTSHATWIFIPFGLLVGAASWLWRHDA